MKGNQALIGFLNLLLAKELTGINQYIVHAQIQEQWGYGKLAALEMAQAKDEMGHAERLIERIIFLEGAPQVGKLEQIDIGKLVPEQINSDLELERDAILAYNEAIGLAASSKDNDTKVLLEKILADETKHIDAKESQLTQIAQMGTENFLAQSKST
jgi:bacterioferritin